MAFWTVQTAATVQYNIWNDVTQVAMLLYMLYFAFVPIEEPMRNVHDPRPLEEEGNFGVVKVLGKKDKVAAAEAKEKRTSSEMEVDNFLKRQIIHIHWTP